MGAPPAGHSGSAGNSGNGDALGSTPTGVKLAVLLEAAAGAGERYAGLDDSALAAAAGRWDAEESWCFARKLGVIREMIRRNPLAGHEAKAEGGMPGLWRASLDEEIALELAVTSQAAEKLLTLSRALEVRLPLAAAALDAGILNPSKTRMVADETSVLSDEDARRAEAIAARTWKGKTWGQISKKVSAAVVNVDPDGARRRREEEEREHARVRLWRERTGTSGLSATGLPTDRALMADRAVQARAKAYQKWASPGRSPSYG
jgi:Domain of unknown function (DUF222)